MNAENENKKIREILHGVKNHFQILNSMFELQLMDIKDETATLAVQQSLGRLRVVTLAYKYLTVVDTTLAVDLGKVVAELMQQFLHSDSENDNQINPEVQLSGLVVEINEAIPIGLILNELLLYSTSIKSAAKNDREIAIRLLSTNDELQCIEFSDSGVVLPKSFDLNDSKLGMGMRMVNGLSRQVGGRAEVPGLPECRFNIYFKQNSKM